MGGGSVRYDNGQLVRKRKKEHHNLVLQLRRTLSINITLCVIVAYRVL